jgi:CIC family chloride channel protein
MTEKLTRRGLRVQAEFHVDVLRTTLVRDVMTIDVVTLPATATVEGAIDRFEAGGHGAYPLVDDDGTCVGIVSRRDLLTDPALDGSSVLDIASRDVVSVPPEASLVDALRLILEEGVEHVVVKDQGRLVGICTRTDILRARAHQFDHERLEPGWREARRARRRSNDAYADRGEGRTDEEGRADDGDAEG